MNASTRSDGSDSDDAAGARLLVDDAGDEAVDPGEVGARQRRERDLVVAGAAQAVARPSCAPARAGARAPGG